jgi:hypothetical protein
MDSDAKEAALLEMLGRFRARWTDSDIEDALESLKPFRVEAVARACRNFRDGTVVDQSTAFAPNAVQLVVEARRLEGVLAFDEFLEQTTFIPHYAINRMGELDGESPEWKAICEQRGRSMPTCQKDGVEGWFVANVDLAQAADRIAFHRAEQRRIEARGPLVLKLEHLKIGAGA